MTSMDTRISELMDGEQVPASGAATVRALVAGNGMQDEWRLYHLIGDAMRRETHLAFDVRAGVMAALAGEPTVIMPQAVHQARRKRHAVLHWQRAIMATAATVAAVAVVAWVALAPNGGAGLPTAVPAAPLVRATLANASSVTPEKPLLASASVPTDARADVDPHLQEYLMAHQAYATAGLPVGGVNHIHTVSVEH